MCNGFGGFYSRDGKVYFTAPDKDGDCSHSDTAERLPEGLTDDDIVPFEIPEWKASEFHWDIYGDPPEWAKKPPCIRKLKEVKPYWKKYKKVRDAAWAEYEKVRDAARAEFIESIKTIDGYCEEA